MCDEMSTPLAFSVHGAHIFPHSREISDELLLSYGTVAPDAELPCATSAPEISLLKQADPP